MKSRMPIDDEGERNHIMIRFWNITTEKKEYREQVIRLYEEAFPKEEKKPMEFMEQLEKEGKMEITAIADGDVFVGLAIFMVSGGTALVDYLAIAPEKRCGGYGGRAVQAMLRQYGDKKLIFEIEKEDDQAPNAVDRRRRKAFYLKNGLKETGLFANVYHTDFELLTPDGELTYEAYVAFLREILGEDMVKRLDPKPL